MGVFKDRETADGAIKAAIDDCNQSHSELMQNALGEFRAGPGEGRPFGAIAQELTKAEIAAVDAGIASVIQAHIDAGYRDAEEIRKRIDDGFIGKVMTTTGAVALSKSGRGFGSGSELRVGVAQRAAFEAARNRLRTGLEPRIRRDLGKPRADTLLRRLIRRFEDHPATALVLLAVGVVLGGWKLVELGFQAVEWITK